MGRDFALAEGRDKKTAALLGGRRSTIRRPAAVTGLSDGL